MPSPPLPQNPSVVPGGGDLVVTSSSDVIAAMPGFVQFAQGFPAPIRDAIAAGLAGIQLRYQEESAYAAAQCDVLRATDYYLTSLGQDRGVFQQPNEAQEAYRARILSIPAQVTPQAIVTAANAVLAQFTTVQCEYLESALDRWYITDGTLTWHAFVGPVSPTYFDRLYRDDVATNGTLIPNREPGGDWVFADENGRYFVLRIPVVADTDLALSYAGFNDTFGFPIVLFKFHDTLPPELGGAEAGAIETDGTLVTEPAQTGSNFPTTAGGRGLFIADGTNTSGAEADGSVTTFLWQGATTGLAIYQAISNIVDRIRGQSVRFMLYVDPFLTT